MFRILGTTIMFSKVLFMKLKIAVVSLCLFYPMQAHADVLSAKEIKQTVIGKRVLLATRYGIEFPLVYKSSGTVAGDGSGTGLGKFFAPKETGKWWIKGQELCQKFPTWYDGRTQCFTLEKIGGGKLKWQSKDGRSGTARIS